MILAVWNGLFYEDIWSQRWTNFCLRTVEGRCPAGDLARHGGCSCVAAAEKRPSASIRNYGSAESIGMLRGRSLCRDRKIPAWSSPGIGGRSFRREGLDGSFDGAALIPITVDEGIGGYRDEDPCSDPDLRYTRPADKLVSFTDICGKTLDELLANDPAGLCGGVP